MKKLRYIAPVTEAVTVDTNEILALSGTHPKGKDSENNFGGETDSDKHPLASKEETWGNIWDD